MIERTKFDGCPVRDKGLQQVGDGGDSDNHHQFNQGKTSLFIHKSLLVVTGAL